MDEGSARAGHLLTRRAVKAGDLLELQRLPGAGATRRPMNWNGYSPARPTQVSTDIPHAVASGIPLLPAMLRGSWSAILPMGMVCVRCLRGPSPLL